MTDDEFDREVAEMSRRQRLWDTVHAAAATAVGVVAAFAVYVALTCCGLLAR